MTANKVWTVQAVDVLARPRPFTPMFRVGVIHRKLYFYGYHHYQCPSNLMGVKVPFFTNNWATRIHVPLTHHAKREPRDGECLTAARLPDALPTGIFLVGNHPAAYGCIKDTEK